MTTRRVLIFLSCLLFAMPGTNSLNADDAIAYRPHIRKLLRRHCEACHNSSRAEAGLDLSTYDSVIHGSSSGSVLAKGDPTDSLLYMVVTHEQEPVMPPKKKLRRDEVQMIHSWIMNGLPEVPEEAEPLNAMVKPMDDAKTSGKREPPAKRSDDEALVFKGKRAAPVTAMAVARTTGLLAVAGQQQVILFDLETHRFSKAFPFPEGEVFTLTFSPDGSLLLAGGGKHAQSGSVVVWETRTGNRLRTLGDELDIVMASDIGASHAMLALGGPGRTVRVFDTRTSTERFTLKKHTDWILDVCFSPDELIFATSDRAGNVFVWESESGELLHTLRGQVGAVNCVDWSADGNVAVAGGDDGMIRLHDMHSGKLLRQWQAHTGGVFSLDVSSDSTLVTSGRDKAIRSWTLDGSLLNERQHGDAFPLIVQFTSKGHIAVGDSNGQLQLWDLSSEKLTKQLAIPTERLTSDISKVEVDESSLRVLATDNPLDTLPSRINPRPVIEPRIPGVSPEEISAESPAGPSSLERVVRLEVLQRQLSLALREFGDDSSVSRRYDEARVLTKVALEKVREELSEANGKLGKSRP